MQQKPSEQIFIDGFFRMEKLKIKLLLKELESLDIESYKKAIEEQKKTANIIDNSFKKFERRTKGMDETSLRKSFDEFEKKFQKNLREWTSKTKVLIDLKKKMRDDLKKKMRENKFPTFVIPDAKGGIDRLSQNHTTGPGLPPKQDAPRIGGYDFLFYGTITALTLLAGRYILKQLNTKTEEKPVEEKFNTEELKEISTLFGNENIAIAPQIVQFNNFQKKLAEDIERFFKDYENIKTTINDKGLTLNLRNLSVKEGYKVFSKFLEEFKDALVSEFKDIHKRQDAEKELVLQKGKIRDLKELVNNNIGNPKKAELIRVYLNDLDKLATEVGDKDDFKFITNYSKKLYGITKNPKDEKTFNARKKKIYYRS